VIGHLRSIVRTAALAAMTAFSCAHEPSVLLGEWEVTDIYCRSCTMTDRSDLGRRIRLSASSVADPFAGGECPKEVGYRLMSLCASQRAELLKKLKPAWLLGKPDSVQWFAVTCGGLDFVVLTVLADESLAYIGDGEITYRLVKRAAN